MSYQAMNGNPPKKPSFTRMVGQWLKVKNPPYG